MGFFKSIKVIKDNKKKSQKKFQKNLENKKKAINFATQKREKK
jgi:hypothetical protein